MGEHELAVVLHVEFIKAEKGQIGEDSVDDAVVAVGADGGVEGKEFLDKHLDEVFVTDAAIEHLLDEHFLVGVFALRESGLLYGGSLP